MTVATHRSVLIVDDEFGLAELLSEMLGDCGYEVTLAINGRLALSIMQERGVDLVISDLMMPVMDGAELAAALRSSEAFSRIPIILMTSLPTAVPANSGLFTIVLRKPFTPAALLRAMHTCFADETPRPDAN